MKLKPLNKYFLLEKIEDKVSELIPEEFRASLSPFTTVKVLDIASDCDKLKSEDIGALVLLQTNGIEQVKTLNDVFFIAPERFVVGKITEE